MFDKLILMAVGVGFCVLFFCMAFVMLHLGHMYPLGVCLFLSACGLSGFILTMAEEGR